MTHPILRAGILAGALASLSAVAHARNDWRCDAPIDSFAPPGCAYIPEPDDGICTSFPATGAWTCLSGWVPSPASGERGPPTALQSLDPSGMPIDPTRAALTPESGPERLARIAVDLTMDPGAATSMPLLGFRQTGDLPARVDVLLVRDGHAAEIVVVGSDAESSTTLATLPLSVLQPVIYARWSAGRGGPRLVLDSGTTRVETTLPVLDGDTRLVMGSYTDAEIELDCARPRDRPASSD